MCIITGLTVGLGLGITSALGMTAASTTTALVAGTIGTTMIAGGVAAVGAGIYGIARSVGASNAYNAQMDAATKTLKNNTNNTGTLEVNKTATQVQEKDEIKRNLTSLRVPLAKQQQADKEMINNVYGVDTNLVASATQMQTGLNIAA